MVFKTEITTLRQLKDIFNNDKREKYLFCSTGGFHGTSLTLDDVEHILNNESNFSDPVGDKYWITILVVYPEEVDIDTYLLGFGDIAIEVSDIQWLREKVRESLEKIKLSQEGNM